MRPGAEFAMVHGAPTAAAPHAPAANGTAHSPWQSPVPYLFGGLAAMLGLIAFALLILACSYWKLSGYLDGGSGADEAGGQEGAAGDGKGSAAGAARPAVGFLEHVVVIMAGEERPTFLATPATSRAVMELETAPAVSPYGGGGTEGCSEEEKKKVEESCEESSQSQLQLGGHSADAGAASRSLESSSTTAQQESKQ